MPIIEIQVYKCLKWLIIIVLTYSSRDPLIAGRALVKGKVILQECEEVHTDVKELVVELSTSKKKIVQTQEELLSGLSHVAVGPDTP